MQCSFSVEVLVLGRITNLCLFLLSYISGITLLGLPTEVYVYGMQIMYIIAGMVLFGIFFPRFLLPVFHELGLKTLYQVLQQRYIVPK